MFLAEILHKFTTEHYLQKGVGHFFKIVYRSSVSNNNVKNLSFLSV